MTQAPQARERRRRKDCVRACARISIEQHQNIKQNGLHLCCMKRSITRGMECKRTTKHVQNSRLRTLDLWTWPAGQLAQTVRAGGGSRTPVESVEFPMRFPASVHEPSPVECETRSAHAVSNTGRHYAASIEPRHVHASSRVLHASEQSGTVRQSFHGNPART